MPAGRFLGISQCQGRSRRGHARQVHRWQNAGATAGLLSERAGIKEILTNWEAFLLFIAVKQATSEFSSFKLWQHKFYLWMCDLDRARHRQLISVPLNLVWRGSKARAKSLTCVWWWVLALAGLGLEHPHVDFACCCSASSQGSGWVPSASIQRKTEREGVAKAVIFYGQLSEVR